MKSVLFVGQIVIIFVCWSYILFSPKYRRWKTKRKFLNSIGKKHWKEMRCKMEYLLELLVMFFNPKQLPDRHAERQKEIKRDLEERKNWKSARNKLFVNQDIKGLVTKERKQSYDRNNMH